MTDFYAARNLEFALFTARTFVFVRGKANITGQVGFIVAPVSDINDVIVRLVRPGGAALDQFDRVVGHDLNAFEPDRPGKADRRAGHFLYDRFARQP